jgi:hypothetical protein
VSGRAAAAALAALLGTLAAAAAGAGAARADEPKKLAVTFDLDGYYRTRAYYIHNLFPRDSAVGEATRDTSFLVHRLRLEPIVRISSMVVLHVQMDALDGALWGENAGLNSVALFATDTSVTPRAGVDFATGAAFIPSLLVKRAWLEVALPVGTLRVGRMPSNWGMGLLANGGDGFDDDFGENHGGSTNDRILFATKPFSLAKTILGADKTDHPFTIAYAYDKISTTPLDVAGDEDPLSRAASSAWLDRRRDEDGDGREGEDPIDQLDNDGDGLTDEDPPGSDDVNEHVFVAIWNQPNAWIVSRDDDLKLGTYIVYRTQQTTESKVLIVDLYGKLLIGPWYAEGEWLTIRGATKAIPLGVRAKKARIYGGVGRVGWLGKRFHVIAEAGFASGDDEIQDETFTRRPLHSDYNVGLLLYEEVLAEGTARYWGPNSRGLWSNGGVYSSFYFFPRVRVFPIGGENLRLIAGVLTAFGNKPECATIYDADDVCRIANPTPPPPSVLDLQRKHPYLGTEIDVAVKYAWWEDHLEATLELGYLFMGPGLLNESGMTGLPMTAWTLQSRLSFVF